MSLQADDRIKPRKHPDYQDIILEPAMSYLNAVDTDVSTHFSNGIDMYLPFILANADIENAVRMAQMGGIAILPNTMPISKQADMVRQIKRFQSRIVRDIISVTPETPVVEALEYHQRYKINVLPVVENGTNMLAGFFIVDDSMEYDAEKYVGNYMVTDAIPTMPDATDIEQVYELLEQKNAACCALIDAQNRCVGLVTKEDKEKSEHFPNATIDINGALRVAAMVNATETDYDRINALMDANVDVIVIDAEHAHSKTVTDMVTYIRRQRSGTVEVIAGNIVTTEAALALIDAGANGIKAGNGPNYTALGMDVPHFSALMDTADAASLHNLPVVSDGGNAPHEIAKTFAAGATSVMVDTIDECKLLMKNLRKAMAYTGCMNLYEFRTKTRFVRVK